MFAKLRNSLLAFR